MQKLHQAVKEEQKKRPADLVRRYVPSSREWQLAKIKRHIQKRGKVQNKEELAEVEKKLAELYRN
ncbi:MAG: hypothetical protein AABY40_04340 [Nanoarchaeota archaeon]